MVHVELITRIALLLVVIGLSLSLWHAWVVDIRMYFFSNVFPSVMYLVRYFVGPTVDIGPMTYHV